jgi:pilus assembly protein Flp/PilA
MLDNVVQTMLRWRDTLTMLHARINTARVNTEERGATMVEYALLVAVIAIVVAGAAQILGTNVVGAFTKVSACVTGPSATTCK